MAQAPTNTGCMAATTKWMDTNPTTAKVAVCTAIALVALGGILLAYTQFGMSVNETLVVGGLGTLMMSGTTLGVISLYKSQ